MVALCCGGLQSTNPVPGISFGFAGRDVDLSNEVCCPVAQCGSATVTAAAVQEIHTDAAQDQAAGKFSNFHDAAPICFRGPGLTYYQVLRGAKFVRRDDTVTPSIEAG